LKYFKLFLISIIAFGLGLFGISLLFPSNTFVSRAANVFGPKDSLQPNLPVYFENAFDDGQQQKTIEVKPFLPNADTLLFHVKNQEQVQGGIAVYDMGKDSSTIQVFYKINVPWYSPLQKFGLMLNEEKYGPSLDTALRRITTAVQLAN